ncbi:hypothetical protein [Sphingosinithalassobacter portus]|uniref:hypothetical protein n=1 Tax=Stakelama portus TaxID=2676234 RepID=UPI000D6E9400|nr:hypothetical protein [Sphingosinithalassobacter portus]
MSAAIHEKAERLGRKRVRTWTVLAILLLTQEAVYFTSDRPDLMLRAGDWMKTAAWMILSLVLLAALWTGGTWFASRAMRALIDDEGTRANRADALSLGFGVAILTALAIYAVSLFEPVRANLVVHLVVSMGLLSAVLRFGLLEQRAYRGG